MKVKPGAAAQAHALCGRAATRSNAIIVRDTCILQRWTMNGKRFNIILGDAIQRQFAQNAAGQPGELVAMACAHKDEDVRVLRQRIEHKATVGRQRIQTGLRASRVASGVNVRVAGVTTGPDASIAALVATSL